ncbi:MAG: hypothetical protein P4L22_07185 [Candidatus Babeliales bacterium]|nr:hypothetical protein [Candidatus Babeliales bacterium]
MKKIILAIFFVLNVFSQEVDFKKLVKNWHLTVFLMLRSNQHDYVKNWILYRIDKTKKILADSQVCLTELANFFKADDKQREIQAEMDYNATQATKNINVFSKAVFKQIVDHKLGQFDESLIFSSFYKEAQLKAIKIILEYYEALLLVINNKAIQSKL